MPGAVPILTPRVRSALFANVEFSVSDDARDSTTMIPARPGVLEELREWAATCAFADDWWVAVERLTRAVRPDAALFRVDWSGAAPQAFTWYARFPVAPSDEGFHEALRVARPFHWTGPSPQSVAAALGCPGPRGVGLRADAAGNQRTAVYYRLFLEHAPEGVPDLAAVVQACGLPPEGAAVIADDLRSLGTNPNVEVVGVDQGSDGAAGALKFNPGDVPVGVALRFLASKGATACGLRRVASLATGLGARALSYLGLKYNRSGFAGWRAYFSVEPSRRPGAARLTVAAGPGVGGRMRIPQF
jgi:hypothetical protein